MKKLLAVILGALVLVTAAAPLPEPPCWPANVGGTGTAIASGSLPSSAGGGTWSGWWCPDPAKAGDWIKVTTYARGSWAVKHPETLTGLAPDALARAYWTLNTRAPSSDTERAAFAAAEVQLDPLKPPPPKIYAWIVPAAEDGGTRRMFLPWNDYLLQSPAPVLAGTYCDCEARKITTAAKMWSEPKVIEPTGETYCSVRATTYPELVAVCRWLEELPKPGPDPTPIAETATAQPVTERGENED